MPTAKNFSTLGAFNGFSSCLERVDISGYDYWITLSGYSKDSGGVPTKKSKNDSLKLAMKLFWNTYRVEFYSFDTLTLLDIDEVLIEGDTGAEIEPRNRVCGYGSLSSVVKLGDSGATTAASVDLTLDKGLVMMYDGSVIESNFIGYGMARVDPFGVSPLESYVYDGIVADSLSIAGGYGYTYVDATSDVEQGYTTLDDVNLFFIGAAALIGAETTVDVEELSTSIGSPAFQVSQIVGFDFYAYD